MNFQFIDIHIHIQPWNQLKESVRKALTSGRPPSEVAMFQHFIESPRALLEHMDREKVEKVALINYPSPNLMGFTDEVNDFVLNYVRNEPKRLLAVGSIDPHHTKDPIFKVRQLIDRGIRMIKVHPVHQAVYPNAYMVGNQAIQAIYEVCQESGAPVMIHTGTSTFPGARNKFGDPLFVEDVAVDFPSLTIIMAHGGRPLWTETAFFLLRRFDNLYLDISGIPPQRILTFFPRLENVAERVVFGSDWPSPGVPGMAANAQAVWSLPLPERVRKGILRDNALRLFPD